MNATNKTESINITNRLTVDTIELQHILSLGRKSAVEIGVAANAKIVIGKRIIWSVQRISEYLYNIAA